MPTPILPVEYHGMISHANVSGYGVIMMMLPRVTSCDALRTHPGTFQCAVFFDCLPGVFGTGRFKHAGLGKERSDRNLIQTNGRKYQSFADFGNLFHGIIVKIGCAIQRGYPHDQAAPVWEIPKSTRGAIAAPAFPVRRRPVGVRGCALRPISQSYSKRSQRSAHGSGSCQVLPPRATVRPCAICRG